MPEHGAQGAGEPGTVQPSKAEDDAGQDGDRGTHEAGELDPYLHEVRRVGRGGAVRAGTIVASI